MKWTRYVCGTGIVAIYRVIVSEGAGDGDGKGFIIRLIAIRSLNFRRGVNSGREKKKKWKNERKEGKKGESSLSEAED